MNGQPTDVRLRNLEAHAFRTDCRLRDLEALVAQMTGIDELSPGGQSDRLDRLERELQMLSQWLSAARRTGHEGETNIGNLEEA